MSRRVNGVVVIEVEPSQRCTVCRKVSECRPYGKNGAEVCFKCATASPEAEEEAKRQMGLRLFGEGKA